MRLRVATEYDVPAIVAIHLRAFEGFFLTSLGGRFLYDFYRCFVGRRDSVLTVVCDEHEVVAGFLAGVKEPSGFFARMRSRSGAHLLRSALRSIRTASPRDAARCWSTTSWSVRRRNQRPVYT